MKTKYSLSIALMSIIFSVIAQDLKVISSPETHTIGYMGTPIDFDGNLYLQYRGNDFNHDLFKFNQTDGLVEIPSPAGYDGVNAGYIQPLGVFGDKLYLKYLNNSKVEVLFSYDGSDLIEVSNPSGVQGDIAFPIEYKSELYLKIGVKLVKLKDDVLEEVAGSDGYRGDPFILNGKLYLMQYIGDEGRLYVVEYSENGIVEIDTTPYYKATNNRSFPIHFDGKVYLRMGKSQRYYGFYEFDGTNLKEIDPPYDYESSIYVESGYWGDPIVFDSNIYFRAFDTSAEFVMIRYDGETLEPMKNNIDNGFLIDGYLGHPIVFQDRLFVRFGGTTKYLAELQSDELNAIVNGLDVIGNVKLFASEGHLYFRKESNGSFLLSRYDGDSFEDIEAPSNYTGRSKGYYGAPYEFNGSFYFRFLDDIGYTLLTLDGIPLSNDDSLKELVFVYPNPATEYLRIDGLDRDEFEILTLKGKRVIKATYQNGVDISELMAGVYILRLVDQPEKQYKFVKK